MLRINDIKKFITNDFESATITGKLVDGKLVVGLILKSNSNFKTVSYFGTDIKSLKKDSTALCNVLLDYYLENNEIASVNYDAHNRYYIDKYLLEIDGSKRLTLAFEDIELLSKTFPNLVKKIEAKKKKDILNIVESNIDDYRELNIRKDNDCKTRLTVQAIFAITNKIIEYDEFGMGHYEQKVIGYKCNYYPLYVNDKLHKGELEFIENIVYEFLKNKYVFAITHDMHFTRSMTKELFSYHYKVSCSQEIFDSVIKNVIERIYNETKEIEENEKLTLERQMCLWKK